MALGGKESRQHAYWRDGCLRAENRPRLARLCGREFPIFSKNDGWALKARAGVRASATRCVCFIDDRMAARALAWQMTEDTFQ